MTKTTAVTMSRAGAAPRGLDGAAFDRAYADVILGNHFVEDHRYYHQQKPRYRRTMEHIARIPLPERARILETGGGQIALLCTRLFDDQCVVADVNEGHADAVTGQGLEFRCCDLLHDDLEERGAYDLVVLCEVIEHMPVPPHIVLEKIKRWIRPGGVLFLTTPNLYRIRNAVRLFLGMPLFDTFFYPDRGQGLGHPVEYSLEHLRWHLERAGFDPVSITREQLVNAGASMVTKVTRWLISPLQLRPLWRDTLVAVAHRPESDTVDAGKRSPELVGTFGA